MTVAQNPRASTVAPGTVLAGYRIVRRLGHGPRATVWLGHAGPADAPRIAAIKVYREGVARDSIDSELHALSSASHPHVVQLLDLSSTVDPAPCLILERLSTSTLATVLAERDVIPAGEAVTMIAPVVAAIAALHESDIAHGRITANNVLFRETGAPVLVGFGSCDASATEDREALVAVVRAVLSRVRSSESLALDGWLCNRQRPLRENFAVELSERIFELGQAQPIQFAAPDRLGSASPARTITAQPLDIATTDANTSLHSPPLSHGIGGAFRRIAQIALRAAVARLPAEAGQRAERLLAAAAAVRRPVWLALGVGVIVLAAGIVTASTGSDSPDSVAGNYSTDATSSSGQGTSPSGTPTLAAGIGGPVTDDDPVAAFAALWALRRECVSQLSVLCLDDVDQNGSAALDEDAALIAAIENGSSDGSRAALTPTSILLVERHGDAALIGFALSSETASVSTADPTTEPTPAPQRTTASALLVKSEAGWRVRDYLGD